MEFKNFENSYRTNFYIKTATGDIHNFKNGHKHNVYTNYWNELKYFNGCDAELTIYPTEINQNSKPQYMKIKRGSLVLFPKHSKYSLKYINVHNISPTVYRVAMQMIDPVTNDEFAFERNPYIITDATPLSIIDQMKIITTSSGSLYQDEHLFYSDIHLLWHLIYNTLYPTKNSTGNIKNILLYIEKNPNIMPSNKELADLCHVSVSTITRLLSEQEISVLHGLIPELCWIICRLLFQQALHMENHSMTVMGSGYMPNMILWVLMRCLPH